MMRGLELALVEDKSAKAESRAHKTYPPWMCKKSFKRNHFGAESLLFSPES